MPTAKEFAALTSHQRPTVAMEVEALSLIMNFVHSSLEELGSQTALNAVKDAEAAMRKEFGGIQVPPRQSVYSERN